MDKRTAQNRNNLLMLRVVRRDRQRRAREFLTKRIWELIAELSKENVEPTDYVLHATIQDGAIQIFLTPKTKKAETVVRAYMEKHNGTQPHKS